MKRVDDITIELTNRCNCRCSMCDVWKDENIMDLDLSEFENIMKSSKGIKFMCFTGGEPMMLPNLIDYYSIFRKYFPKAWLSIATNGFFKEKTLDFLDQIDAKKVFFSISYDGVVSHDSIRGLDGSAQNLLSTALALKDKDIPVGLKMTITPENYNEIYKTACQAKELGLSFRIKLMENLECHQTRSPKSTILYEPEMMDSIISQAKQILSLGITTNRRFLKDMVKKGKKQFMRCNWTSDKMFISVDGRAFLCRKMQPLGNIYKRPISDIIESSEIVERRKEMEACKDYSCLSFCHQ